VQGETMDPNPLKSQIDTLIDNLCKETSEAAISKTFSNYLAAMSKFYQYSFFNSRLILFANPAASQVAGYKAWNKFNRYVKRGEHGIPILAPCLVKDKETNKSKIVGFKTAYVFDVSQTEEIHCPRCLNGDPPPSKNQSIKNYLNSQS